MNINTNSWHYRLIKNTFFRESKRGQVPTSLCPYARALFYRIAFFGTLVVAVTILLSMMGSPLGASLGLGFIASHILGFFASVVLFGGMFACACVIGWGVSKIAEYVGAWKRERAWTKIKKEIEDKKAGVEPKEPGIIKAFIMSKHDAVCPTLTFVDKE